MRFWIAWLRFAVVHRAARIGLVSLASVAGGRLPWLRQSKASLPAVNVK